MLTAKNNVFEPSDSLRFFLLASDTPSIFSLGGDLRYFAQLVETQDKNRLEIYARKAMNLLWSILNGLHKDLITLAVVHGKCFGGGFETILACDYIIAEESALFSFPEIGLGIFPGMGGASLLSQITTRKDYSNLLTSSNVFSSRQLHDMGLVDLVVDDGDCPAAVTSVLKKMNSAYISHKALFELRKKPILNRYEEFAHMVDVWINAVLKIDKRRLSIIKRIAEISL